MKSLPFGISQFTTWTRDFEQDLELYRRVGIEHGKVCEAELSATDPHPHLRSLRDAGFNVSSIHTRYRSPFPNVALLKAIRNAGYTGIYSLEIFSDLRLRDSLWKRPTRTAAEGRKAFQKIWRQVCA